MNYLISGGGTGGHIFPAISIANALREQEPDCKILFVGAKGRMEMERVPQAGYDIVGLPIKGFDRRHLLRNVVILFNLLQSMCIAHRIVRRFRPDVGIGVGGYASGAAMKVAARMGVPIVLQEQNGFAGVTNKLLKNDATTICVAYEGMERFFPKDKILFTGNPVRQDLLQGNAEKAVTYFNEQFGVTFNSQRKTLLIIGGSLGARTINDAICHHLPQLLKEDIQIIWQTGSHYFDAIQPSVKPYLSTGKMVCTPFLSNMADVYALSTLVISRAGASSISELCLLGKAVILVPSPNVAEDHQTHNAMALVHKDAAVLVRDADAELQLVPQALALIGDESRLHTLQDHIRLSGKTDSARLIANEVIRLARHT